LCATPQDVLTLGDVEQAALKHSQDLSIADLNTLIATEKIREIQGINMPKLSAEGNYTVRNSRAAVVHKNPQHHNKQSPPHIPGAEDHEMPKPPKRLVMETAPKEVATGKISLVVPVYDFGYGSSLKQAQESLVEASVHDKDRIRQDLLFLVSTTFYRTLEARKVESVVRESIRILAKQLTTAQDLYSVGLVTKNDTLSVEVQLAERHQALIEVCHTIESSLATLNRLTGLSSLTIAKLQDIEEPQTWNLDIAETLAQADKTHPVLKKIIAERSAASFNVDATKAENYPDINAFCNAHSTSDKYLLHKNWLTAGLELKIPIYDGGIVAAQVAQQRTAISAITLQYDKAVEDIHLHIRKSCFEVDSAYHRLAVAKQSIKLAEDNLTISQDLFEEGQILSDDVLDNEGRLSQARLNYFEALYEFYMAQSELEYAAGLIQLSCVG
jgi:outer membrane protein TolC